MVFIRGIVVVFLVVVVVLVNDEYSGSCVNAYSPLSRGDGRRNIFRLPNPSSRLQQQQQQQQAVGGGGTTSTYAASPTLTTVPPPVPTTMQQQQHPYPQQLYPGMAVRSNVGGSQDDQYYFTAPTTTAAEIRSIDNNRRDGRQRTDGSWGDNDPIGTNGGRSGPIQIHGTPNGGGGYNYAQQYPQPQQQQYDQYRRQDVPPTPPRLFTGGMLSPTPMEPTYEQQEEFYAHQHYQNHRRIPIRQTGSNVSGSSVSPSFDVPPSPPGVMTGGVRIAAPSMSYVGGKYYLQGQRPHRQGRGIPIEQTGQSVAALQRTHVPLRNHHIPTRYHINPYDRYQNTKQQQQQQQSYFPTPSSSSSSNVGSMSNYYEPYDTSREFAFDRSSSSPSTTTTKTKNLKPLYKQLQDTWNKHIQKCLDGSRLFLQASVWLQNAGYDGMSSYATTRSNTLRSTAIQFIELGYDVSSEVAMMQNQHQHQQQYQINNNNVKFEIKIPKGLASQLSGSTSSLSSTSTSANTFQRKTKNFKNIVDIWNQLVKIENEITDINDQLIMKMMTNTETPTLSHSSYLVNPTTIVSTTQSLLNNQVQQQQSVVSIADYISQIQYDDNLVLQYDYQFGNGGRSLSSIAAATARSPLNTNNNNYNYGRSAYGNSGGSTSRRVWT